MSGELLRRLARRAAVLALTLAVIGVGVGTVQLAARWRAESAPIDAAPVGMDSIGADAAAEVDRTQALSGQVDDVTRQIADLGTAVSSASDSVSGDTDNAQTLQKQLDQAKTRLQTVQKQLKAAQARLDALNAAAARQAALNAAARRSAPAATSGSGGYHDDGGGEHDD
jgi:septal ring factor EnvC (AmiA/AmiB activator)